MTTFPELSLPAEQLSPWSTEEGKRVLFRNFRRLSPEYTLAIAGELKQLARETLILLAENDVFQKPAYACKLRLMKEKLEEVSSHLIAFLDAN